MGKKQLRVFASWEAAEDADRAYYAALTPQERLDLLLDLVRQYRESIGQDLRRQADLGVAPRSKMLIYVQ